MSLLPAKGERTLSVGQTGSGKTAFNVWLLNKLPFAPVIIYDTKEEPKFLTLPTAAVAHSFREVAERLTSGEHDYIVFRPPDHILHDPQRLDEYLYNHYMQFPGVDGYIDEIYSFHSSGRPHMGLQAMLTRGRSRGISLFMSTQRPVWLSKSALTESNHLYIFTIVHEDDRKILNKVIPGFEDKPPVKPKTFRFYHYDAGEQKLAFYNPVKLDAKQNTGYTDEVEIEPDADKVRKLVWI